MNQIVVLGLARHCFIDSINSLNTSIIKYTVILMMCVYDCYCISKPKSMKIFFYGNTKYQFRNVIIAANL